MKGAGEVREEVSDHSDTGDESTAADTARENNDGRKDAAGEHGVTHIIYQGMCVLVVGVNGFVCSLAMAFTSPALPSMRADPDLDITPDQESWVGAVTPACALVGSLVAGPMVDRLGRRVSLLLITAPFFLSWAQIAAAGGVGGIIVGRMMGGVCVGMVAVAGTVFMSEIVELELRGPMGIVPAVLGNLGLLVSFAAGQWLSWRELAWLGGLCVTPVLLLLLWLPETPHHLTRTGRSDASLAALYTLRASAQEAQQEQDEINRNCSQSAENEASVWEMAQPPNLWPVSVAVGLMVAQQTTGINVVVFFASTILEAGGEGLDGGVASVLLGSVNFVSSFVGMAAMAKWTRRYLLQVSTWVLVPSLLTLSLFFWAQDAGGSWAALAKTLYFVPVLALLSYLVGFSFGWGPVPWVFLGEGIPSRVRGKAVAGVVGVNWGLAFVVTKSFAWSMAAAGAHATFLAYAVLTAMGSAALLQFMPETFGKSVTEMDDFYMVEANKKLQ